MLRPPPIRPPGRLLFAAHDPGDWFFGCHKPMHMEGGMITLVKVA